MDRQTNSGSRGARQQSPQERIFLTSTPIGNEVMTSITRLNRDGSESIEIAGIHEVLDLELEETVRGREMVLPQRARLTP